MAKAAKKTTTRKSTTAKKTATAKKTTTTKEPTTAKKTAARGSVRKTSSKPLPTEDQIRQRAFEIFLRRNGGAGDADGDWHQAERELSDELAGK